MSEPTYQRCRNQYGGMKTKEANRRKELEQENVQLKTIVADLSLDKQILSDALDYLEKE